MPGNGRHSGQSSRNAGAEKKFRGQGVGIFEATAHLHIRKMSGASCCDVPLLPQCSRYRLLSSFKHSVETSHNAGPQSTQGLVMNSAAWPRELCLTSVIF